MKKAFAVYVAGVLLIIAIPFMLVHLQPFHDMDADRMGEVPGIIAIWTSIWITVFCVYTYLQRRFSHRPKRTKPPSVKLKAVFFLFLLMSTSAFASDQNLTAPGLLTMKTAPMLVTWFTNLVSEYDKFVDSEKQKQFIRRLNALNDSLYQLKRRKQDFFDLLKIEAEHSSNTLAMDMKPSFEQLKEQYMTVKSRVDVIGGMVSQTAQQEGVEISKSLEEAVSERTKGILEIQEEIRRGQIDLAKIENFGTNGINAIEGAHSNLSKLILKLKQN